MVASGNMGEISLMEMSFLFPFFVVLGDGIKSIVDSSMSCKEPGRVLIWDFRYDSYVSIS